MKCTKCRLHKTCRNVMQLGNGNKNAKIMVIQENPFQFENRRKMYMSGRAGRLLMTGLSEVGIDVGDIYFTGLVKCSTPDDRPPLNDEVKACTEYLMAEIDVVQPDIIIPTGNLSLKAIAKKTGITKQRGKLIECNIDGKTHKVFPLIHPNTVLKQPKYMELFSKDLINLSAILNGESNPHAETYKIKRLYCEDYKTAMAEISRLNNLPKGSNIAFDLETVKSNPFIEKVSSSIKVAKEFPSSLIPKIVAIGFSDRGGYGCSIPLEHRQSPFNKSQLENIIKALKELFANPNLIFVAQNGKFDMKWLRSLQRYGIEVKNFLWDTMLMHYLAITEEKGTHSLSDLAWLETDMGGYDAELERVAPKGQDEGNYDLIDWDILKVYLAGDCDVTFRILDKYKKHFKEGSNLRWIWDNLMLPGSKALLDIECDGAHIDKELLEFYLEAYSKEIKRIEEKLRQFPEVLEMERERQARWDERVAIGKIKKANRTEEQQEKFVKWKKYDPTKGGVEINFGSTQQVSELLFDRLGLKTVILTDKGNPSTNDDSLKYIRDDHPICDILLEFRKVRHLYNNFIVSFSECIDGDSKIHPSYLLHGTVTGRLSSKEPNLLGDTMVTLYAVPGEPVNAGCMNYM